MSKEKHVKKKQKQNPSSLVSAVSHWKLKIKEKRSKDPVADHVDIWVVRIMRNISLAQTVSRA